MTFSNGTIIFFVILGCAGTVVCAAAVHHFAFGNAPVVKDHFRPDLEQAEYMNEVRQKNMDVMQWVAGRYVRKFDRHAPTASVRSRDLVINKRFTDTAFRPRRTR